MYCPYCNEIDTKVIDSRLFADGRQVKRRRECLRCNERFTTFEVAELVLPCVMKRDGRRSAFDEKKLRAGILRSLEKRPVTREQIETLMQRLLKQVRTMGERDVPTQLLGEWVMKELELLDQVAYVRFASVYRSFQDIYAFKKEVEKLKKQTSGKERKDGQN